MAADHDDLTWALKLEVCRLELAKERMHAAESALATAELRRLLKEAQSEVERLRAACEGERVDIEAVARELWDEVDAMKDHPYQQIEAILRRHWPTAPKPAAGGEDDWCVVERTPQEWITELQRQCVAKDVELAAANQRAEEAESDLRIVMEDVESLTQIIDARNERLMEAERLLRKVEQMSQHSSKAWLRDINLEIRSFLTPKESGDEVPAGEMHMRLDDAPQVEKDGASPQQPLPAARSRDSVASTPAQALPADDGKMVDERLVKALELAIHHLWNDFKDCTSMPQAWPVPWSEMRARQIARWNNFNWLAAQSAELDALRADRDREAKRVEFLIKKHCDYGYDGAWIRRAIDAAIAAEEVEANG